MELRQALHSETENGSEPETNSSSQPETDNNAWLDPFTMRDNLAGNVIEQTQ